MWQNMHHKNSVSGQSLRSDQKLVHRDPFAKLTCKSFVQVQVELPRCFIIANVETPE